ncbi:hypothetical protein CONPUDRAFT_58526 [Coniophora puteana RWD-64-598 SS2]|uniref:Zn(2)-C6 fungal-type domain-containing protein n=1 Tax=Coniophora puteana (strain RWD-64-598) TaxID=741705 RepID=A0A5M3MMT1_CONPW|nr:uncharacterized protein CONPUDRAFT_58526 [Coniophora puteana RWD-64-598 SS2]EIW80084.1 hypothetical protein CONPUDRAFT_58526 [Coniophora puteana RWD-64-598 SS2]
MSYHDEYDDGDELGDLPSGLSASSLLPSPGGQSGDKIVRRRSSKACDQCRKSKCKCERSDGDACKSCVMLGTPCTFLGPSRKRGPPKGYIDAIEARLHQTEALLGILIGSDDDRARGVLNDLSKDPLAREIINRVDGSPYGSKGRKNGTAPGPKTRPGSTSPTDGSSEQINLQSTHPSNEWQDKVATLLARNGILHKQADGVSLNDPLALTRPSGSQETTEQHPPSHQNGGESPDHVRRQRRRVEAEGFEYERPSSSSSGGQLTTAFGRRTSPGYPGASPIHGGSGASYRQGSSSSVDSESEDEVTDAVGQLSLNEDEQVRYHGKASGLYLLGINQRQEARNEGGIWRFPKARVWPPLPPGARDSSTTRSEVPEDDKLPSPQLQEHLLELYFTYVHPVFPVLNKAAFFEAFRHEYGHFRLSSPGSPASDGQARSPSSIIHRPRRVPALLLLSMYAVAARYSPSTFAPPQEAASMWTAGDDYLNNAKVILDSSYASSRPTTCQALLLMGFREIGIGAMAQAWAYVGMAVRMAQDLGMHRCADGWARVGLGGRLFSEMEIQERRRIWYGCVMLDKYVSTYIGRPLAIFERDYDTQLPSETEPDELELWSPFHSSRASTRSLEETGDSAIAPPVPARTLSCFNASSKLSGILSRIVQDIYSIRPGFSRHAESMRLEGLLNKWYLDLPQYLRYEPGQKTVPPPHILTLHMHYWCTSLLLYRPLKSGGSDDGNSRAVSEKNYELCVRAANHISSIAASYREHYDLGRSPVFLTFYLFTASIMHVTSLSLYHNDPQARVGLSRCMDALQDMQVTWPSAARALELLRNSKGFSLDIQARQQISPGRNKRAAEGAVDEEDVFQRDHQVHPGDAPYSRWRNASGHSLDHEEFGGVSQSPPGAGSSTGGGSGVPYFSPYERWPAVQSNYMSFPGTISTSVLPQVYSTGLIDDRVSSRSPHRMNGYDHAQGQGQSRYPQFWNDYTSLAQMGMAYGDVAQPHAPPISVQNPPPQGHSESSPIYMQSQYNPVYSELCFLCICITLTPLSPVQITILRHHHRLSFFPTC